MRERERDHYARSTSGSVPYITGLGSGTVSCFLMRNIYTCSGSAEITHYVCVCGKLFEAEAHFALHGLSSKVAGFAVSLQQQQLIRHFPRVHLHTDIV